MLTILAYFQLEKLTSKDSPHYDIICFHYYIQFHLHIQVSFEFHLLNTSSWFELLTRTTVISSQWQLSEAAEYARDKGVVLKGDLPIGVDRNSVDTWVYPTLFRMNTSTGAPPDYFDKNGQNWGFPTYNWEEMSKDNYGWWRARLTQVASWNFIQQCFLHLWFNHRTWIFLTDGEVLHSIQDWSYIGFLQNLGASWSCDDWSLWKISTIHSPESGMLGYALGCLSPIYLFLLIFTIGRTWKGRNLGL